MDTVFPHIKDVQFSRPIRSQTPVLSLSIPLRFTQDKLVEGLYPLSYGCVWEYYTVEIILVKLQEKKRGQES